MPEHISEMSQLLKIYNLVNYLLQKHQVNYIFNPLVINFIAGKVYNYENVLVEQGSTWVFRFTLLGNYSENSTVRFIFPEGFTSNKVQCNITGIIDSQMKTRVFPQLNIYDCLNVRASLSGSQNIILSGVVNPNYRMQMEGLKVHIIQPNNLVVQ
jgi:hypothetical protein